MGDSKLQGEESLNTDEEGTHNPTLLPFFHVYSELLRDALDLRGVETDAESGGET